MISINGTQLSQQPATVLETPLQIRTKLQAIDGTISVHSYNTKIEAILTFDFLSPSLFQFFKSLGDATNSVTYTNTLSNVSGGTLTFTGILDYVAGPYIRGGDALVPLTVTIRQV